VSPLLDFDWSVANDYLVSASSDGTCRLWEATSGLCLRAISDTSGAQNLSCCFHPAYSNFVAVSTLYSTGMGREGVGVTPCGVSLARFQVGNSKSQVKVFNASTGMAIKVGGQSCGGRRSSVCV